MPERCPHAEFIVYSSVRFFIIDLIQHNNSPSGSLNSFLLPSGFSLPRTPPGALTSAVGNLAGYLVHVLWTRQGLCVAADCFLYRARHASFGLEALIPARDLLNTRLRRVSCYTAFVYSLKT